MKYVLLLIGILSNTLSQGQVLIFADKIFAAAYLSQDSMDGYFDQINELDMKLQLRDTNQYKGDRRILLEEYRKDFQNEVTEFDDAYRRQLSQLFKEIFHEIKSVNDQILPDTIILVALNGRHFGPTGVYTRGQAIAIPMHVLKTTDSEEFRDIMYHEMFHILSRIHEPLGAELYGLIGFEELNAPIVFDSSDQSMILLNPDGLRDNYTISLELADTVLQVIPVIYSKVDHYKPEWETFFQYLDFQLIPISNHGDHYRAVSIDEAKQLNQMELMSAYFDRITQNTQYIIHPDEILADNFMYLFQSEEIVKDRDNTLLSAIKQSLIDYKPNQN